MLGNVKDKVSLITGAASGLGKGIAIKFAENGSHVVIADLDLTVAQATADELTKEFGVSTLAVQMDVTSEEQVQAGVDATIAKFGRIDVLVSNAGIQIIAPIVEFEFAKWKKLLDIHLNGTFLTTKACMQKMIEKKNLLKKIILDNKMY